MLRQGGSSVQLPSALHSIVPVGEDHTMGSQKEGKGEREGSEIK